MLATPLNCYHCALPIKGEPACWAHINGVKQPMCCVGCRAVSELILGSGLGNYYNYRTAPAATADSIASLNPLYDEAAFQKGFVRSLEGELREAQLLIEGIRCAACVWLLEHRLQALTGVKAVNVSLHNHSALIQWDASQAPLSEIVSAIEQLGYRVTPYNDTGVDELWRRESRHALARIGIAGMAMMQISMFAVAIYAGVFQGIDDEHKNLFLWVSLLFCLPVISYASWPFYQGAWRGVQQRVVAMDTPISLALLIAFFASLYATISGRGVVYYDSVAMFVFLLLTARFLETRSRHDANALSHRAVTPSYCRRLCGEGGDSEVVAVAMLTIDDRIRVVSGDTVPADGVIIDGRAALDESSISGEFMPANRASGERVRAGTVVLDGSLTLAVSAIGEDTDIALIQRLARKAQLQKPQLTQLADRLARHFAAVVLLLTTAAGLFWYWQDPSRVLEICLAMLVVSCPCALSLATPSALAVANGALRRRGLLVTNGQLLETARHITDIVFDKTGTLTSGAMTVLQHRSLQSSALDTADADRHFIIAAALEAHSEHPIAAAFARARTTQGLPLRHCEDVTVSIGQGIEGFIDGQRYRIGSAVFTQALAGSAAPAQDDDRTTVWLATSGRWLGVFTLGDQTRAGCREALQSLRGYRLSLLTGDSSAAGPKLAAELGIDTVLSGQSAEQKLAHIRQLQAQGRRVLMIGDGINDVPVLAAADASIAMGNASDLAKIRADAVLLGGDLAAVEALLSTARQCQRIVRQNIGWALAYNFLSLPLAAIGWVPPWVAALGMSLSSLLVVANAGRLRHRSPRPSVKPSPTLGAPLPRSKTANISAH